MKIKIKAGNSPVIATHIGKGDDRRMLFIAPWGCSLSTPKPAPKGADLSAQEYVVEASGECERLLRAALKDGHKGLVERIEIIEPEKKAPAKHEPKL